MSDSRPQAAPLRPVLLIVGLLLLRTVLLGGSAVICAVVAEGLGREPRELYGWLNVVIVGVDLVTILVIARLLRADGRRLRDLVGGFRPVDLAWAGIVMFAVFVAYVGGTFVGNALVFAGPPPAGDGVAAPPLWMAIWTLVVMSATVAVAEELLYRGYAQEQLARRWPLAVVVIVIAVFFGLQHLPLAATSPADMVVRFVATFLAGIAFGVLRVVVRRLSPLIIGHWAFDVAGLGVPAVLAALA
jgi:uncharacterized protein